MRLPTTLTTSEVATSEKSAIGSWTSQAAKPSAEVIGYREKKQELIFGVNSCFDIDRGSFYRKA